MSNVKVKELMDLVSQGMAPADIKMWLEGLREHSLYHIKACTEDYENKDKFDDALLAIEEGFLLLYGLALTKGWLLDEDERKFDA